MKLKELSATDLLAYKQLADIVYNFYDNEAKANKLDEKLFREAYANSLKYLKVQGDIFEEIRRRVDDVQK